MYHKLNYSYPTLAATTCTSKSRTSPVQYSTKPGDSYCHVQWEGCWLFSHGFNNENNFSSSYPFYFFLNTFGALHMNINTTLKQLNSLRYSISLPDNFESSLRCDACQVTLSYRKKNQAAWMLKRHWRVTRFIKWKMVGCRLPINHWY